MPEELPPEAPSEPSDQTVLVAGQPKLFVDITDEDKTVMTPDEYAHYYEVYMANM